MKDLSNHSAAVVEPEKTELSSRVENEAVVVPSFDDETINEVDFHSAEVNLPLPKKEQRHPSPPSAHTRTVIYLKQNSECFKCNAYREQLENKQRELEFMQIKILDLNTDMDNTTFVN